MKSKDIQLNFIAVHLFAAFLMILGARELFMLLHAGVVSGAQAESVIAFVLQHSGGALGQVPESYFHGIAICGLLGLATSVLLTSMEAEKKEISKVNVLFVAIPGFWLAKLITGAYFHLHHIVPPLHDVSEVLGLKVLFLLNTLLLFSAALLLMLRKNLVKSHLENLQALFRLCITHRKVDH